MVPAHLAIFSQRRKLGDSYVSEQVRVFFPRRSPASVAWA